VTIRLDHVAILTTSLETCAGQLPAGLVLHEIEEQPTEGTREQYVTTQAGDGPALLLLEAVLPGPYQTALEKRGPGLHHLGCTTDSLDEAIEHFSDFGLLLHPISLDTYPRGGVWLCRPGVPYLIELFAVPGEIKQSDVEIRIDVPQRVTSFDRCFEHIPGVLVRPSHDGMVRVAINGKHLLIRP